MYPLVAKTINLGVNHASGTQASKIKITNIASLIACFVALCNAVYFHLQLGSPIAATLNVTFALIYCLPLIFSYLRYYQTAKILIFAAVMSHAFVLSTQIFTNATGFHYYYLLLPSCLFLMFSDEEKFIKLCAMGLGLILFFICENHINPTPLVNISATAEKIIFSSTILVVMLEIYLITYIFSRSISRNERLLQQMANKDWLTGLNNRGMFVEIAQNVLHYSKRYNKPLSLLMLDIDFFKQINDNYGHLVGDQVLKHIGQTLQSGIRASDTLARYGGEEFVIILPETACKEALELAKNLQALIENTPLKINDKQNISYKISVGVAEFTSEIDTLDELTNHADIALYQAKESGRNTVCLYQSNKDKT
jgi:diguanylate cyclase (GGDEF)-like protein